MAALGLGISAKLEKATHGNEHPHGFGEVKGFPVGPEFS